MPFFLFIEGLAIALALKRVPNMKVAIKRIFVRTIKLMFWGILLQGGYSPTPYELVYGVDMKKIRWFGILQVWWTCSISCLHGHNIYFICARLEFQMGLKVKSR